MYRTVQTLRRNTHRSVNSRRYTQKSEKTPEEVLQSGNHDDHSKCGLCGQKFEQTDLVFNCTRMHVFHTRCFEVTSNDKLKELNKCPACNAEMDIVTDDNEETLRTSISSADET